MAEFEIAVTEQGKAYLKDEVRKALGIVKGQGTKIAAVGNGNAVLLFPPGMPYAEVMGCLDAMKAEVAGLLARVANEKKDEPESSEA